MLKTRNSFWTEILLVNNWSKTCEYTVDPTSQFNDRFYVDCYNSKFHVK